jgi:hypothetical protein
MTFTAFEIHKDLVEKEGMILKVMNITLRLIKGLELTFLTSLVIMKTKQRPNPFSRWLRLTEAKTWSQTSETHIVSSSNS